MKGIHSILIAFSLLAFACLLASAFDPSPLQDFCVAIKDIKDGVFVNGRFCKDPKLAVAEDFFFSGPNKPGNTSNQVGSNAIIVDVDKIPGLNTLGISLARIDYARYGLNPPHTHPRGTEILAFKIGKTKAVAFVGFSSQNAGVITNAKAAFGSNQPINPDVLAKAFQLDKDVVKYLQSRLWSG
ncbi:Germin-like protein subfamily 1 member 20 [Hibiscus syriacus]|uniref:Germin-like protein subfamily 1 member 20 n=1 Tax=Hibiscus syriacus TaxID=106335 RepID=A0A6A3B3E9_HIBSY|nr:Germin-like protein subfamily 1 member 20 [Hibiscus syriacus]